MSCSARPRTRFLADPLKFTLRALLSQERAASGRDRKVQHVCHACRISLAGQLKRSPNKTPVQRTQSGFSNLMPREFASPRNHIVMAVIASLEQCSYWWVAPFWRDFQGFLGKRMPKSRSISRHFRSSASVMNVTASPERPMRPVLPTRCVNSCSESGRS